MWQGFERGGLHTFYPAVSLSDVTGHRPVNADRGCFQNLPKHEKKCACTKGSDLVVSMNAQSLICTNRSVWAPLSLVLGFALTAAGPSLAQDNARAMPLSTPVIAAPTPVPVPVSQVSAPKLDPVSGDMLAKDMADLKAMLTGRWDNELQAFFEPELGVPVSGRHDRLHTIVRPLEGGGFGANTFYVEYRQGGEAGAIVRQRIWTLSVDAPLSAIRLAAFAPKDGKPLEGAWRDPAKLVALAPLDFVAVAGCDLIWRRRADGFSGETRPGSCKLVTTGAAERVLSVSERHDLSQNVWDVRDIGVDERGTRVFGSADNAPTRLRRAAPFLCWAGARAGAETVTQSDLVLHDQGGFATARLAGATPNIVSVRLRNVDWPIGQNRPSLTLYLMTGTSTEAKAYAWSEPDSKRIALDMGGTQVSCTRDDRALWR
jgi:hypothetical protein